MVKRMLIDATHPEETRVVVLDGTRLDEFDVETSTKKQIKGNIYLAKVVRVEPSLQAAFVDYGGNRHGFLAFGEIHPDYYQIPVADRERLLAEAARHEEEEEARDRRRRERAAAHAAGAFPEDHASDAGHDTAESHPDAGHDVASEPAHDDHEHEQEHVYDEGHEHVHDEGHEHEQAADESAAADHGDDTLPLAFIPPAISAPPVDEHTEEETDAGDDSPTPSEAEAAVDAVTEAAAAAPQGGPASASEDQPENGEAKAPGVETIGGEDAHEDDEEEEDEKHRRRFVASRHYKIQEVIKRRQIMLVQVVKEERGSKGAALTTYLSLAGRYCVLMPNAARGGGVSRKITSAQDRRRLKQIVGDLELPRNMAVILRTAGADRSKAEIKRDYEYLQRTWNNIREVTMQSRAPALIHEEASLIKRSIRDIYSRDIEELWVEGEEGYKVAKDFMRMLTPSHAKKVQRYKDDLIPLFHRYQVESQMETINSPVVQLRSGGSIVFGQTEALVAIDVNSGRATRERHIEETAYKTNMEAAEEIARQLRLRDLAGLVVIDFIDMEDNRNNHAVERRLKDALKADRARIQVGRISHFGLLELSRQRLRPSLIETNFKICGHCAGTGLVRSTESAAVHTLRMIEEEGARRRSSELTVTVNSDVALYLLNYKREALASMEARYGLRIFVLGDAALIPPNLRIDRVKAVRAPDEQDAQARELPRPAPEPVEDVADETEAEEETEDTEAERTEIRGGQEGEHREDGEGGRRRRRRRRRRRGERGSEGQPSHAVDQQRGPRQPQGEAEASGTDAEAAGGGEAGDHEPREAGDHGAEGARDGEGRRRRRGRRGGRRRRRGGEPGEPREGELMPDGEREPIAAAMDSPFPTDRTHPAVPDVHPDETAEPSPVANPAATAMEPQNGEKRGFFRALKEGALGWRRNDATAEPTPPEPIRAAPPPPPPPPPSPPPSPPLPEPPPAVEQPEGPPRRGWWQQNKTE